MIRVKNIVPSAATSLNQKAIEATNDNNPNKKR